MSRTKGRSPQRPLSPAAKGHLAQLHQAIAHAKRLRLFVLAEGDPESPSWAVYDKVTGQQVARYFPARAELRIGTRRATCADTRDAIERVAVAMRGG